jgi:GxxExxY protein
VDWAENIGSRQGAKNAKEKIFPLRAWRLGERKIMAREKQRTIMNENEIGRVVVDAAIAIHRELGPGLLETAYEAILARELMDRGLAVERQVPVPIQFRGIRFEEGFRADLIVAGKVILELKSVETVNNAHKKQLLTYLKLTGMKLGFLLNFGEALMKNGITRTVNQLPEDQ